MNGQTDEEVEIRVRLPENYRILSTLDTLKVRTKDGLVPLSNFITRSPVKKLAEINRIDQKRFFDIKAGVSDGLKTTRIDATGQENEVFINANERRSWFSRSHHGFQV